MKIAPYVILLLGLLAAGYGLYKLDKPWLTFFMGLLLVIAAVVLLILTYESEHQQKMKS